MTFLKLKEALDQLDDEQLKQTVELRAEEIIPIAIAIAHSGVPFFCYESTED